MFRSFFLRRFIVLPYGFPFFPILVQARHRPPPPPSVRAERGIPNGIVGQPARQHESTQATDPDGFVSALTISPGRGRDPSASKTPRVDLQRGGQVGAKENPSWPKPRGG